LITQQETKVSKFPWWIFRNSAWIWQIKTFGGRLAPSALHHWMDSAT